MRTRDEALLSSCVSGASAAAKRLLDAGADPNARDETWGFTNLHWACIDCHTDIARLLLQKGADVNARGHDGNTPLHVACDYCHTDLARLLLDAGARVDVQNEDGRTPLELTMSLSPDNPARELIIDQFREFHPELVMEAYCQTGMDKEISP